ncbi:pyridoxamine 5'-phosphate oxidase family protein [Rhodococcus pyridinivorans]|uniref:pyridoxamine 5'-phosphate oxidase family protein n=1 Tax=Rhodococcus pyridinivorans TaxID=103816 RepID=UPI0007614E28|nr:pyridoxamine 5'-phosphate oxidase family protein [Rhodococcus pyridinivorans]
MPKLTDDEFDEFLATPGLYARFATVDEDGFPRVIPIIFLHHERCIKFTLRPVGAPLENVRRTQKVAFSIDEPTDPQRRVNIQGLARVVYEPGSEDKWLDVYRTMLLKTATPEYVDDYIRGSAEAGLKRPWLQVELDAPTTRIKTWRLNIDGETKDRPVPMARKYLQNWDGSAPANSENLRMSR